MILTTLAQESGDQAVSYDDIADLYPFRWNAELDFRNIKTVLKLHHVRCKSPEMVHREFWTTLLAYNLTRVTLANSVALHHRHPRALSYVSACQFVLSTWQEIAYIRNLKRQLEHFRKLLERISTCLVRNRPGRIEPRVVKKRRHRYRLMTQPRNELRQRLQKGDNGFET